MKVVHRGDQLFTPFERRVYTVVSQIPLGEVRSYQWVARKAGNPKAVRAVGQALKRNPYPLLIPCHRVVRSDGTLGGFAFGRVHKKNLIDLERKIKEDMI
jgi:methylated-DNA-[protein]-cysteine S-methyltransferase